jgi:hypothetical protein
MLPASAEETYNSLNKYMKSTNWLGLENWILLLVVTRNSQSIANSNVELK